jgi:hypothetical protein
LPLGSVNELAHPDAMKSVSGNVIVIVNRISSPCSDRQRGFETRALASIFPIGASGVAHEGVVVVRARSSRIARVTLHFSR